jgi:hypothetical protein
MWFIDRFYRSISLILNMNDLLTMNPLSMIISLLFCLKYESFWVTHAFFQFCLIDILLIVDEFYENIHIHLLIRWVLLMNRRSKTNDISP